MVISLQPNLNNTPASGGGHLPRNRPRLLWVLAALALLAGAGIAYSWAAHRRLHFACVEPGVLYRSGQPSGSQLAAMAREQHIRTVINLRQAATIERDKRGVEEMEFAKLHGLRYVNIPYTDSKARSQIPEFLALVADPANRPVLVHCAEGIERSGVMVAAFRMKTQGWSLAQALAEMRQFGYKRDKSPGMQRAVEEFAASLTRTEPPAKPPDAP